MPLGTIIGSIASGLIGQGIASKDKQDTFAKQKQLLSLQNNFSEYMQEKTNRYNSPAELLKRLRAAGLTTTGALSAITGNVGQAQNVSSTSTPSVNGMDASLKNLFGDLGLEYAQIENIKADTRNKNAESNRNESTLYYDINNLIAQNNLFKAEVDKIYEELNLTKEQINYQHILNKYADKKSQEEINSIIANYKNTMAATENLGEEKKKLEWENFFRTNFGIDPHDNAMSQLIQASLKGDMSNVFNAFEKTANLVWDKGKEYFNTAADNIKPIVNELTDNLERKIYLRSPWLFERLTGKKGLGSFGGGRSSGKGHGYSGTWGDNEKSRSHSHSFTWD